MRIVGDATASTTQWVADSAASPTTSTPHLTSAADAEVPGVPGGTAGTAGTAGAAGVDLS